VNRDRWGDGDTRALDAPTPPEPLDDTGRWIFRGYDQMGLDVWSWDPHPTSTGGQR
jgi:hypothetical protein